MGRIQPTNCIDVKTEWKMSLSSSFTPLGYKLVSNQSKEDGGNSKENAPNSN
jgi:hypothetical protein